MNATLNLDQWLLQAHSLLAHYRSELNSINVFPVADADTGSNMEGTLAVALPDDEGTPLSDRLQATCLTARGNSGTILAAWLLGFGTTLLQNPTSQNLTLGLTAGAQRARAVLLEPREGTMLTVMESICHSQPSTLLDDAHQATQKTRQQLKENQEAATADSGAVGFLLIISALSQELGYKHLSDKEITPLFTHQKALPAHLNKTASTEKELMFNLILPAEKLSTLKTVLPELGNSITITELSPPNTADLHVAVHLHTRWEKKTLKFIQRLGDMKDLRTSDLTCH